MLTDFHGDCNAGGTGVVTLHGGAVCYRDAHTPALCGPLRADRTADAAAGSQYLLARFSGTHVSGSITGGLCEYRFSYERQAP